MKKETNIEHWQGTEDSSTLSGSLVSGSQKLFNVFTVSTHIYVIIVFQWYKEERFVAMNLCFLRPSA